MSNMWRTAAATRALLIGALVSTAGLGSYGYFNHPEAAPSTPRASQSTETTLTAASFSTADAGSCLTWEDNGDTLSNFEQTDCAGEHRFEVSSREDLGAYPSSEFGEDAPMPDLTRQAQLREELCLSPTLAYLEGNLDPLGRFSVASILPPAESWKQGDRTLLCGIQATDENGALIATSGRTKDQDQSRVFASGECVAVDNLNVARVVECEKPHQLEITQAVNLREHFPEGTPSVEDQDNYLRVRCTDAAREYMGSDDALYYSTLQPFWTTQSANSFGGGSHSVNCALVSGNPEGKFRQLEGSAKNGLKIDGQPPEQRPERSPIVNPDALKPSENPAP